MSNEAKVNINQIVLLLVSPPIVLLIISLLFFLLRGGSFGGDAFMRDFDGSGFRNIFLGINFPLWLFLFPYPILFYFRKNENIYAITKLGICGSSAVAFLGSFEKFFDGYSLIRFLILTGLGMFALYWKGYKNIGLKKVDFGNYPLAIDSKGRTMFPTDSLHMNVQIVGGTGTGKTRYVIKPFIEQTILQDLGCFIYDVKGNMARDVAYYFDRRPNQKNSKVYFNVADPKRSHSYNPLYGDNADAIANRVSTALYFDPRNAEPYYMELGKAFLHNLIGLLKTEIKTITFLDLLLATEEAGTFRIIQWFCAKHPETPYARYFKNQWLSKPSKQRQEELSGLVTKLQRFCNSEWSHLLNVKRPDITMDHIVQNNGVFLFSPDAARYPDDAKPLAILAMMDLSQQLSIRYNPGMEKKPFRVFLDEFYNLAYPRFIDFINKCREAEVNLFLAHQSLGDLRGVSLEFQEQVMNTARNKIVLGVDDPETAEHFARQFGTEEDKGYRVNSFKGDGSLAGYSMPQVEKFRFHPNLIKRLQAGEAIVKIVGQGGVHVFETKLRAATQVPEDFKPYWSTPRRFDPYGDNKYKNESSLAEIMEPKPGDAPKPGKKNGGVGDEDAA